MMQKMNQHIIIQPNVSTKKFLTIAFEVDENELKKKTTKFGITWP